MRNKKLKNNKGITLVALVVTIIVLIILAGVSINLILGENGIITKAQEAKQLQEQAKSSEEVEMQELMDQIDTIILEPGLYDANGVMLCTWEESGIDIEKDYVNSWR